MNQTQKPAPIGELETGHNTEFSQHYIIDVAENLRRLADEIDVLPGEIINNGALRRCGTRGRERGLDGWFLLRPDGSGVVGNHRTGEKRIFQPSRNSDKTPEERAELKRRFAAIHREREAEKLRIWAKASTDALKIWNAAMPASKSHPYAVRKEITVNGLREWRGQLIVPVYGPDGLRGLQFIPPELGAKKKFLTGTRVGGSFLLIGDVLPDSRGILVCEGVATGKTLHSETNYPVYTAFSASNLADVSQFVRVQYPRARIVIGADNDWQTPGNPGLTKAREAAALVHGSVVFPPPLPGCSDFNDWYQILKGGAGHE